MKKFIYNFFTHHSAVDEILNKESSIQARQKPSQLISEFRRGSLPRFIAAINQKPQAPILALRKLTLTHYILIHYPEYCQSFKQIDLKIQTQDQWLNQHIIHPYSIYLYKVINQSQMYSQCKLNKVISISFDMLFYTINMMRILFPCVKKMSSLSRYYTKIEIELGTNIATGYVMMQAFEAQQLYNCFKAVLGEMVSKPHIYIKTEQEKQMIKFIIEDQLVKINQDMKNLFLDKYYFPYGKGYGVKLLREQDFDKKGGSFMEDMAKSQYQRRIKKPKKITLDKILFGEKGHLNPQIMMSLRQIRMGQDSVYHDRNFLSKSFKTISSEHEERTQNL